MPTIPPEHAPPPPTEPHRDRQRAESFGIDPERYDRTRPRYPAAMVEAIVAAAGRDILDVGCGTGIVARQFQAAGCRVLGVEVDARMADFARRGGLDIEVATFEDWDPAARAFDAIVAGQAWHWVDPVAGAAKAARVLRPGGRLAPFWNVGQPPPEITEAFFTVYSRVLPGSVAALANDPATSMMDRFAMIFSKVEDGIRQAAAFGEPEQWRYDWEQTYTRDEWLEELPTHGDHTRLSQEKLNEVLTDIGAAIDALGGAFTMRYTTVVVTAARTGAA